MKADISQVNNSLLKLIKRLIKLIDKVVKSLLVRLVLFIKSFLQFMEGLTEGRTI